MNRLFNAKLFLLLLTTICFTSARLHAQPNPPNFNINFEATAPGQYTSATAVQGWTVESAGTSTIPINCGTYTPVWTAGSPELWVRQTPIYNLPALGNIPTSPFGGSNILQIQDMNTSALFTRVRSTFSVTPSNCWLRLAMCIILDAQHDCCGNPLVKINLYNCSGQLIPCSTKSLVPSGTSCVSGVPGFSITNGISWSRWRTEFFDLESYLGSCVTIELMVRDCIPGQHSGSLYVDAETTGANVPIGYTAAGGSLPPYTFCNSNSATLTATPGYQNYAWTIPPGITVNPNSFGPILNVTGNLLSNSVFTVAMTNQNCLTVKTISLTPQSCTISAINTQGSCAGGSAGSASILTSPNEPYTYIYNGQSFTLVTASSTVGGLSPGNYTVTAIGCGMASQTFNIPSGTPVLKEIVRPFCPPDCRLNSANTLNSKWYNSSGTMLGSGNILNIPNAPNNSIYYQGYTSQGCRDSVRYTLVQVSPGTLTVISPFTCPGFPATATINLSRSPAVSNPSTMFYTSSTGTTSTFSSTLSSTSSSFPIGQLQPIGTYSILANDGVCEYTASVSTSTIDLSVSAPTLLCNGNCGLISATSTPTIPTSAIYYSFTGPIAISGAAFNTATVCAPNTYSPIAAKVVTITATYLPGGCLMSKTATINTGAAGPSTITPIAPFCANGPTVQLIGTPPFGTFASSGMTGSIIPNGILNPTLFTSPTNTLSYYTSTGPCAYTSTIFLSALGPFLKLSTNGIFCIALPYTVSVSGASSYNWSTGATGSLITLSSPPLPSYTVMGTDNLTGCIAYKSFTTLVAPMPAITIAGNYSTCTSNSLILTASGASTYTWTGGIKTNTIFLMPSSSVTLNVTGTNTYGCKGSASKQITVYPRNSLTNVGSSSICEGDIAVLTATGATTYTWNNVTSFQTVSVSPQVTTNYTLSGTENGCSLTTIVTVIVNECLDVAEQSSDEVLIYPNPANDKLFIHADKQGRFDLLDASGRLIRSEVVEEGQHSINVQGLDAGIYLVKFSTEKESQVLKMIIAH